jgi:cellulose synthase operon protein C
MTIHSSGEPIDAVLVQLRAEEPLEQDPAQQAILRHEAAVLEEQRGDAEAAIRDYLAACDGDPELREPLEALVRLLSIRRDPSVGRLLERLIDSSQEPRETARALRELAVHRLTVDDDLAGARLALEQAVEQQPGDAAAWLELELVAAKEGDPELQVRALEARSKLTTDPTWQGLLLIELAELRAAEGDVESAGALLDTAAGLEGRARFASRLALEEVARRARDPELGAHALEGQAELISQGIDDPDAAAQVGVPSVICEPRYAADAWIRAGELRRRSGDAWGAVAALRAAAARMPDEGLVARLSIAAADAAGDSEAAVSIAREQLEGGLGGPAAAAMWLRVGRAAEDEGDLEAALGAYGKALEADPTSIVATTLRTDLLAQGDDPAALAGALESSARAAASDAAKARGFITVAYVWSVRAGDVERGKQALASAVELGTTPILAARVARSFASLAGDAAWYESATAELLALIDSPEEAAALRFELGRARLYRDDERGALEAFAAIDGGVESGWGPWLGRALAAYAVGLGSTTRRDEGEHGAERDGKAVIALAEVEPDAALARGLSLVAALLAARTGATDEAVTLLAREHERDPNDVVIAAFLADLRRAKGDAAGAAAALRACADGVGDDGVAGALALEAGLGLWKAGDRGGAIECFEAALPRAPQPAQLMLAWALRAAAPNDLGVRMRALELMEELDPDPAGAALERFGVGVFARDGEADPLGALEQLDELSPSGDVALAAALGRLLLGASDAEAMAPALRTLEELGGAAERVAQAERFRLARFVDRDAQGAVAAAERWSAVEGTGTASGAGMLGSGLEWLAAAFAADDRDGEIKAREALAKALRGDFAVSAAVSAAAVRMIHQPGRSQALLEVDALPARLMNVELALPGGDPNRRARALRGLGDALGEETARDAQRMAAWNDLAAGAYGEAQETFRELIEHEADDMIALEGFRAASELLGDYTSLGVALARLGNLVRDDARAGELWEQAGMVLLEHTDAHDDAEIAFERALSRDQTREVAFDKLFRRVRARKDNDRLLALIELRLEVTTNETEITKMYWERARVYRERGDNDRALKCLTDVTMLEPDHVGALALAGEISIKKGDFAGAAPLLARLAGLSDAPKKQRLLSGIAAVDLYEKRLDNPKASLEVLLQLYRDGLSTSKVRERLARTAARVGNWEEAVKILERLMEERDTPKGRAEAARLAMAIYRDKIRRPERARKAVHKLLVEIPDDREALELLLHADVSAELRSIAVPVAKRLLLQSLADDPFDADKVELLAEITASDDDHNLRRAALGVAIALGRDDESVRRAAAEIDARSVREPQIVLDDAAIALVADPDDRGPIAELFALAAPVIAEALGPSLKSEDVGRRQRVDSGPLRTEISRWMGALGLGDFDVYVGGRDPKAVKGVAEDKPALVVGEAVQPPLDIAARSALASAVFALRRGTTAVLHVDDATVASIVVAICKDAGAQLPDPPMPCSTRSNAWCARRCRGACARPFSPRPSAWPRAGSTRPCGRPPPAAASTAWPSSPAARRPTSSIKSRGRRAARRA